MPLHQLILRILLGEAGPADIVAAPAAKGVHFRLPNRRHDSAWWRPRLLACLIGGVLVAVIIVAAAQNTDDPFGWLDLLARTLLVLGPLAGILLFLRTRWHFELYLTASQLRVDYIASWGRHNSHNLLLGPIVQFTVVRVGNSYLLKAESRLLMFDVLEDRDSEMLIRLARSLAEHHAALAPDEEPIGVAVEMGGATGRPNRDRPPLNTKIVLTRHESGLTLDFPVPADLRPLCRQRARTAAGVFAATWILSSAWFVACAWLDWPSRQGLAAPGFLIGVIAVLIAIRQEWIGLGRDRTGDCLRQLSIVGNLLIQITKDGEKRIWHRQDIADIAPENAFTMQAPALMNLVLRETSGATTVLMDSVADLAEDYRPRATLEWLATVLRQTLGGDTTELPQAPGAVAGLSSAIQAEGERVTETRISPS